MTIVQYVKKNAGHITRLERALDDLFEGTGWYSSVLVAQYSFRGTHPSSDLTIKAYVESPSKWYALKDFPDMSTMIRQIQRDVKRTEP